MIKDTSRKFMLEPWRWPQNPIWLKRYNGRSIDSGLLWHFNDRWSFREEGKETVCNGGKELVDRLVQENWLID